MSDSEEDRHLTTGEWFITILILGLPLIGIIMYFVWAFGEGNEGRKNFCRAGLLWLAVVLGLAMIAGIMFLVFGGLVAAAASGAH